MIAPALMIRADANVAIGTGHVMRCLALAQAWQDSNGRVVFAMADTTPAIQQKLISEGVEVVSISAAAGSPDDSKRTLDCVQECGAGWIVVDGYQFDASYQKSLKAAGNRVLFVDDYGHAKEYAADLVLNQNLGAAAALYADRDPNSRLLLGPKYALLRREFSSWTQWHRTIRPVCRQLLVLMGGSDPGNLTAVVIEALRRANVDDVEVVIVAGGSNPYFDRLQENALHASLRVNLLRDVSNMAELMAASDIAVSAAGSTCWELCLLGLPTLLIDVAENQTAVAKELHRRGCAIHVGDRSVSPEMLAQGVKSLAGSEELRQTLSRNSKTVVDGKGAARVVSVLCGSAQLRVRHSTVEDRQLLWEWANDPEVRSASFTTDPISWETHVAWFARKIGDRQSLMLIAQDKKGQPVGQIRFDIKGREAYLNISLAKERRGCGLAVPAIEAALQELFASGDCERVHAIVKPENTASMRSFERAGFQRVETANIHNHGAVHFLCSRERS